MLPSLFESFTSITGSDDPLKISYLALAYKPFLSLFNMTGVAQMNPQLQGIGTETMPWLRLYLEC